MNRTMIPAFAATLLLGAPALAAMPHHGVSEQQARQEIVLDGYTHVENLQKAQNGWTAQAMEGPKQVSLLVDNRGDVEKR